MLTIPLVFSTMVLAQLGTAPDVILAGNRVFLVMPPIAVCTDIVDRTDLTADGHFVLTLSSPVKTLATDAIKWIRGEARVGVTQDLSLWSRKNRKSTTVLQFQSGEGRVEKFTWIAGSHQALVEAEQVLSSPTGQLLRSSVYLLSAENAKLTEIAAIVQHPANPNEGSLSTWLHPDRAVAVVEVRNPDSPGEPQMLCIRDGNVTRMTGLPTNVKLMTMIYSAVDGSVVMRAWDPQRIQTAYTLDPVTASLRVLTTEPPRMAEVQSPRAYYGSPDGIQLTSAINEISKFAGRPKALSYYLRSKTGAKENTALVCADGKLALLDKAEDMVLYRTPEGAFVRELVNIPIELYEKVLAEQERVRAISDAKQVALAFIMAAGDNNDVLPGQDGWQSQISKYAANESMIDKFTYVFKGGSMEKVDKPSETVLGYIEGPGGRAVAYIDGHVKWEPNK